DLTSKDYFHSNVFRTKILASKYSLCNVCRFLFCSCSMNSYTVNFVYFQAGQLSTYRFCDNVWTFVMERVEFRDMSDVMFADRVKFVACDGRTSTGEFNSMHNGNDQIDMQFGLIIRIF
ncbi:unnamed protein product, partial [Soboliphyme baturini]|uniref:TFIIA_gamma_C domain-containing protein n=1 Tax=Soboliphyme baturini TaxID=241478 RepID=A0A183JA71_9BILA